MVILETGKASNMQKVNKLSSALKTLMIIGVMVGLIVAGLVIWKHLLKGSVVDSYQACVDAGNPVRESYPSVCATKDGKYFVNPDQQPQ